MRFILLFDLINYPTYAPNPFAKGGYEEYNLTTSLVILI